MDFLALLAHKDLLDHQACVKETESEKHQQCPLMMKTFMKEVEKMMKMNKNMVDAMVIQAQKEIWDFLGLQDKPVQQDFKGLQDVMVHQESMAEMVLPVEMVLQDLKDQLVHKDPKEWLDLKDKRELMENKENRENKVNKENKGNKANAVLQDLLVQLDLPALREREEKLDQWDPLVHLVHLFNHQVT